jgi:putative SOS response-associated peptidase YedK
MIEDLTSVESYNIAPGQPVSVIIQDPQTGERCLLACKWGLVSSWAKHPGVGQRLINARAETVTEKPAFVDAFVRRRCIVPASGLYVWMHEGEVPQPFHVQVKGDDLVGFAGLWEEWTPRSDSGDVLRTCAMITVKANGLIAPFQKRMPAILRQENEATWLDPANRDIDGLKSLLKPYPADQMMLYPVSQRVNSPAVDDPRCVEPVADAQPALPLGEFAI